MSGEVLFQPLVHPVPEPGVGRIGRSAVAALAKHSSEESAMKCQHTLCPGAHPCGTSKAVVAEPVGSLHPMPEVPEVATRSGARILCVLVVPGNRIRFRQVLTPCRVVVRRVCGIASGLVLVVSEGQNRGEPGELVGRLVVLTVVRPGLWVGVARTGDVTRGPDHVGAPAVAREGPASPITSGRSRRRGRAKDDNPEHEGKPFHLWNHTLRGSGEADLRHERVAIALVDLP
jgi:hypothetical protein